MKKKLVSVKSNRFRNYAIVLYPESLPNNFLEIISEFKVECFLSPLHDKDINPDGSLKKPHYHLLIMFEGVKTIEQVQTLYKKLSKIPPEIISSLRGYARYLCHLDNPEKAQYKIDDVKCFSGADYLSIIGLPSDKLKVIREMMAFCNDNKIFNFSQLLEYCSVNRSDWFRVLCDNGSFVMKEYLRYKHLRLEQTINSNLLLEYDSKDWFLPDCKLNIN